MTIVLKADTEVQEASTSDTARRESGIALGRLRLCPHLVGSWERGALGVIRAVMLIRSSALMYTMPKILLFSTVRCHERRLGGGRGGRSPSSCSKPRRQLGHAGVHPSVAFARALLAPGILVP